LDDLSQKNQEYEGKWDKDKREGWAQCIFKSGDIYKGLFSSDRMSGRGQYFFGSPASNSILYVGEFHENTFQGLGKLLFADGTAYYGSF
jgi:hypothetical protein